MHRIEQCFYRKQMNVSSKLSHPTQNFFLNLNFIYTVRRKHDSLCNVFNTISWNTVGYTVSAYNWPALQALVRQRAVEEMRTSYTINTQARWRKRKLLAGEATRLPSTQLCAGYWSRLSFLYWPLKVRFHKVTCLFVCIRMLFLSSVRLSWNCTSGLC